ncbi:MbtH family NRPS accessory protein [Photorhabdus namnaonensis]|uniref:Alanine-anticapsin ligase BacD n=1 Tax=Photorhabdus namnaonensis TaxID=1851568 RepID=A0A1B8YFB1_9GAMM|nr:MbtH family NRPS accessory protein [Photorhabdus namnaonensis]OCA53843.1 Alanine-anticapsin ligase BacD [Photorhabdus namnaonensis]
MSDENTQTQMKYSSSFEGLTDEYLVVINDEEQYACVHSEWPVAIGWRATGFSGTQETCKKWIEEVWTDMRPASLRNGPQSFDNQPLIVIYDEGAALPKDIVTELNGVAPLVLVINSNEHTRERISYFSRFCHVVDGSDIARAVSELALLNPAGIVTFSERALRLTATLAKHLNLPFHDLETVYRLTDKYKQRVALQEAGIESIRFYLINTVSDWEQAVEQVCLPAVLKPSYGGGSIDTYLIEDPQTGKRLVEKLLSNKQIGFDGGRSLVLEEFLQGRLSLPFGDYVSVESLVVNGEIKHINVTGKMPLSPPFREYGHIWPSVLSDSEQNQIYALTSSAIKVLGVNRGITHTELKLTEQGPRIIEVNGRVGGGINEMAKISLNISLLEMAARLALGKMIDFPVFNPERVYFNICHIAPTRPCEILRINGEDELLSLDGVSSYRPYVWAGTTLPGGSQTNEINMVLGKVDNHKAFLDIYQRMGQCLRFHVRFMDSEEVQILNAHELGAI